MLARSLRPGDTFLDVGANIGYHTLLAASAVGPDGFVVALESDPVSFAILQQNIQQNGLQNILALNLALGATEGSTVLHEAPRDGAMPHSFRAPNAECRAIEVPMTTATSIWKNHLQQRQVAVVRIDSRCLAPQVIQGMHELIAACRPPIFLDFQHDDHQGSGDDARTMFEWLAVRYAMVMIDEPKRQLRPALHANCIDVCQSRDEFNHCRLIAAPPFLSDYLAASEHDECLARENLECRRQLAEAVKLKSMLDTTQFELEKIRAESARRAIERDRAKENLAALKEQHANQRRNESGIEIRFNK